MGKESKQRRITESLCCTGATNTMLSISYYKIFKNKSRKRGDHI